MFEIIDLAEAAGVGVVRSAHGSGKSAVASDGDLSGGGGRDLSGGKSTGENQGSDGGTDDEFHCG